MTNMALELCFNLYKKKFELISSDKVSMNTAKQANVTTLKKTSVMFEDNIALARAIDSVQRDLESYCRTRLFLARVSQRRGEHPEFFESMKKQQAMMVLFSVNRAIIALVQSATRTSFDGYLGGVVDTSNNSLATNLTTFLTTSPMTRISLTTAKGIHIDIDQEFLIGGINSSETCSDFSKKKYWREPGNPHVWPEGEFFFAAFH